MNKISIIIIIMLNFTICIQAQTIQKAEEWFNAYKSEIQGNKRNDGTYEYLYNSYQQYMQILQNEEKSSQNYIKAKVALLEIFHHLGEAAYYFTEKDDEQNVVKYARPFVEIALKEDFADKNLFSSPDFPQFPFFLANNAYLAKEYQESIPYYEAYLQSGDMEENENAFAQLASAFYHLKLYDEVISISLSAVQKYPNNWSIVNLATHACEKGKVDQYLQRFLDLGKNLNPSDPYFMEMQAGLYERQQKYVEAAKIYMQLDELKPNLASISSHLGIDFYNAGTQRWEDAEMLPNAEEANYTRRQAKELFKQAVPYLQDVLSNYPYAVNIMHTLAMCQNILGDTLALEEANKLLIDQKVKSVEMGDKPILAIEYKPVPIVPGAVNTDSLSYVDADIPEGVKANSNKNTYAIVIGNENYKHLSQVNYAHNDAKVFSNYCRKTFGIPNQNITLLLDATKIEMDQFIAKIEEQARMSPGQLNFIIYYAGHGLPDMVKGISYLVPSDADGSDFEYCYSLTRFYEQLDKINSKGVTIFLDACFSGAARNGGSVLDGRYVYYPEQNTNVEGKTVAFSAANGQEASLPYDEERHGIYTYVLLKALKESKGDITYGKLAETLKNEVDRIAWDTKNKHQSPKVSTSISMEDSWEKLTLPKK